MIGRKITAKIILAAIQIVLSLSIMMLAIFLEFNVLNLQSAIGMFLESLNFYILALFGLGFVSIISAVFLIYDWRTQN